MKTEAGGEGHIEIDINPVGVMKVRRDTIVGRHLRQRARAARPSVGKIGLATREIVIGIIEGLTGKAMTGARCMRSTEAQPTTIARN
jgi:hypothetical protein